MRTASFHRHYQHLHESTFFSLKLPLSFLRYTLIRTQHVWPTRDPPHSALIMAAAVKALNAKIRSNPVSDYLCSTRESTQEIVRSLRWKGRLFMRSTLHTLPVNMAES